jgi:hypothetical protein
MAGTALLVADCQGGTIPDFHNFNTERILLIQFQPLQIHCLQTRRSPHQVHTHPARYFALKILKPDDYQTKDTANQSFEQMTEEHNYFSLKKVKIPSSTPIEQP